MSTPPDFEIFAGDWKSLREHLQRDAIVVLAQDLDLRKVAEAFARDEVTTVSAWLGAGQLAKPTAEQIADWGARVQIGFSFVIVQPYILIQQQPN